MTDRLRQWTVFARRSLGGLRGPERLGAIALGVIVFSLMLPWYGLPSKTELVVTGWGAFSWTEAALIVVVGGTAVLLANVGNGYVPPRPLSTGSMMLAAGGWAAAILIYRMFDRPELELGQISERYTPRQGIVIALGGALLLALAGAQSRWVSGSRGRRRGPKATASPG